MLYHLDQHDFRKICSPYASAFFLRSHGSFQSAKSPVCGMLQVAAEISTNGEEILLYARFWIAFINVFIRREPLQERSRFPLLYCYTARSVKNKRFDGRVLMCQWARHY